MPKTVKGITIPDTVYLDMPRHSGPLDIASGTVIVMDLKTATDKLEGYCYRYPLYDPQQALDYKGKITDSAQHSVLASITVNPDNSLEILPVEAGDLEVGKGIFVIYDVLTDDVLSNELEISIIDTTV